MEELGHYTVYTRLFIFCLVYIHVYLFSILTKLSSNFSGTEVYYTCWWIIQSSLPCILFCSFFYWWFVSRNWRGCTFWSREVFFLSLSLEVLNDTKRSKWFEIIILGQDWQLIALFRSCIPVNNIACTENLLVIWRAQYEYVWLLLAND